MSRCCVHDFTSSLEKGPSQDTITTWLKANCKTWVFQKEKGEGGYLHYQGRFSLTKKAYAKDIKHPFTHLSITSKENCKNNFYVLKSETRIAGPWKDDDPYIPKSAREPILLPFQHHIMVHRDNDRTINVIIDEPGAKGKTFIARYIDTSGIGCSINFMKDYRDIMRSVMNQPKKELYIIDIPRAIPKGRLAELYAAIESIKDGYAFDDRYKFKKEWFEPPTIWVFTNTEPVKTWLSADRWALWTICPKSSRLISRPFHGARSAPCNTREIVNTISCEKFGLVGPGLDQPRTPLDMSDSDMILRNELFELEFLSDSSGSEFEI